MDQIIIRYGESLTLPIDAGDITATGADLYVGNPGEPYFFTKHADLTAGVGVFAFTELDTQMILGSYKYQVNITDGINTEIYPSPEEGCDLEADNFPDFIVAESLTRLGVS